MVGALRVLLIGALACAGKPTTVAAPVRPEPGQIRVMSYNVNFGLAGDPTGVAAVASANPDLVFLQETNRAWQDALVGSLSAEYPHVRFAEPDGWPAGGLGVMSRFPIVSIAQLPSTRGPFFAWRVIVDTPIGRIQVLNLHLRPPMSDGGSWVVGYFSTRDDRLAELEEHLEAVDRALPTLFVGDFNEETDGRALRLLKSLGYHDAIPQLVGDRPTWRWPVASGVTLRFQLDHVLYDDRLIAVRAHIVDAGRSDHLPIWVDFQGG